MEEFSITTRMTAKEYAKLMLTGIYKKPKYVIGNIFGLYFIITIILDHMGIINWYDETPKLEICLGIILLLLPLLVVIAALRQFKSNANSQSDIVISFNNSGFTVKGLTCKSEYTWTHIRQIKEIGGFLILCQSKNAGNFIDKKKLSPEQVNFIKSKIQAK